MQVASELYRFRSLVLRRTAAELRYRYASTAFGGIWALLHPLSLILVYSLVFGLFVPRGGTDLPGPFPIVLCSGLLPWLGLTEAIQRGCSAFQQNRAYLKKLSVPEPIYVAQGVLAAAVNMVISIVLLMVVAALLGVGPSWTWLWTPLPLLLLMLLGFGVGLAVATLNVFLPDVGEIVPVVLRIGMWLAPVIVPFAVFRDAGYGPLVGAMPPTAALLGFQDLFFGTWPPALTALGAVAWAAAACILGGAVFRALRAEIKDVL